MAVGLLTACGGREGAGTTTPRSSASTSIRPVAPARTSSYRFARKPIVVYTGAHPDPTHNIVFSVFVRLNRALPRTGPGSRGRLLAEGVGGDGLPFTNSRKRACYTAEISGYNGAPPPPTLTRPRDGELVTITLRFPGRTMASVRVRARKVGSREVGYDQANERYLRRLGC